MRPCFLVIDPEHSSSISSRKLVLETAKFNVITAYSCGEAKETLQRFPAVHGVVLNAAMKDADCAGFFEEVEAKYPDIKRILVGHLHDDHIPADVYVETFVPVRLLDALRQLFPAETAEVERQEKLLDQ